MVETFRKAKQIWAKNRTEEKNVSLFFSLSFKRFQVTSIRLTANHLYRMILNGKQIGYGPSRAAHDYYRVDTYMFEHVEEENVLIIEVSGYNCRSFYTLLTPPFFIAELYDQQGRIVFYTGRDFECYLNETRLQKVVRFSYQRAFSESYRFDERYAAFLKGNESVYSKEEIVEQKHGTFLSKNLAYPTYPHCLFRPVETGVLHVNPALPVYDDRYMHKERLGIFPKEQWEIDANKVASSFEFRLEKRKGTTLYQQQFVTYAYPRSLSGFFCFHFHAIEDSLVYIIFDEVNAKEVEEGLIDLCFWRNTTHNILTYALKKGSYQPISFEAYTAKFIRVIVLEGCVDCLEVGMMEYIHPEANRATYHFEDARIETILDAARATFAQNAVDLLTDCPSRERAGWLFDSFFSAKAEQFFVGHNQVEANFLENYVLCKKTDIPPKMIPMCYPADFEDGNFIPNWSLWYILELEDYLVRTGNRKLVDCSKENVRQILSYFEAFENEEGLLEDLQGWVFVEWSKANDDDFIAGVNFPSNMLYYRSLLVASKLYKWKSLETKAEALKQAILKYSFNGHFFEDNCLRRAGVLTRVGHITETCQYYAFYFGVATPSSFASLFSILVESFGPKRNVKTMYPEVHPSNVLPGDFLRLFILNQASLTADVLKETVDYFYKMAMKTGTLWEHDSVHASLNHAFTSVIFPILLDALLGIKKIDQLQQCIVLSKNFHPQEAEVTLPIGKEKMIIRIRQGKREVEVPKNFTILIKN